ncbi:MAG: NHLP family bacteriocin export ABC transporter peptidase/permease/ATPase subunit [bacterium]|nr:NHLP family bacteriocin export ABC transporter peptidase/permease/ATPase subunit [bacterium]
MALSKPGIGSYLYKFFSPRIHTPLLLQMEAVECGAAALGIILAYFGREIPLEELRIECGVSRDGSRAVNIIKVASKYGLTANAFHAEQKKIKSLTFPLIAFWESNHFLVVEDFKNGSVYLNDPVFGHRVETEKYFFRHYSDIAVVFTLTSNFKKSEKKNFFIEKIIKTLKGYKSAIYYILITAFFMILSGIIMPLLLRLFIDQVLIAGTLDWIKPLIAGMLGVAAVHTVLRMLQNRIINRFEAKYSIENSSRFIWRLLSLPAHFFAQRSIGEISSRSNLPKIFAHHLSSDLLTAVSNYMLMIFYILIMLQYSVPLTMLGILITLVNVIVLKIIHTEKKTLNQKLQYESSKLMGATITGLQAIETIKANGTEPEFFSKWSGYQAKVLNTQRKLAFSLQIISIVPVLLTSLNTAVILSYGSVLIMKGQLSMGMLVAFMSLMASFIAPVNRLISLDNIIGKMQTSINRINDLVNYKNDSYIKTSLDSSDNKNTDSVIKLSGKIELKNITFGYNNLEKPFINNLTLSIKPGTRVALVGPSGCGKSTISKLVSGLYKPWKGSINIDGNPISSFSRNILSHSIAMVNQDIFLFKDTVKNNITLWNDTIPGNTITKAAKDALIHHKIAARTGGYDSIIDEGGVNFSGGERQLIEIARALVINPVFLILDEATSALDAETERQIDASLRKRGCTCLIISHRLSTIRDCDEIIVLDKGELINRGTHDDLYSKCEIYRRLINY